LADEPIHPGEQQGGYNATWMPTSKAKVRSLDVSAVNYSFEELDHRDRDDGS